MRQRQGKNPGWRAIHGGLRAGFSLVELMVVVAIIGILAAVAIPKYIGYLYRSRTTEAVGFLADIKARQEAYRSEYFQYCSVSGNESTWWPEGNPTPSMRAWGVTPAGWVALGVSPPREVRFVYQVVAGSPGTTPAGGLGYDGSDFWFVARARGDLNGDGTFLLMESYSHRQSLYNSSVRGWD